MCSKCDTKEPIEIGLPFDLEAAKRGEKIIDQDGDEHHFIAYVPDAREHSKVVTRRGEVIVTFDTNGRYIARSNYRLFMAPKSKRTASRTASLYEAPSGGLVVSLLPPHHLPGYKVIGSAPVTVVEGVFAPQH